MELEDLQRLWQDHDRRLDASLRLNTRRLRGSVLGKAETALSRLARWLRLELLLDLAIALWLGSFIADHVAAARFLVPAVGLQLCVLALLAACIRQLAAIGKVDYGAPIVAIQQRLESLRRERLRAVKLTLLVSPLLWIPLLIVTCEAMFQLDVYATFSTAWLVANLLAGLALIPAMSWISKRYADRMERSPLARRLMRDLAGRNLAAAAGFLRSLAEFVAED